MQHPILLAALADDLGHRCPCGAVTQQTDGLCRGCPVRVKSNETQVSTVS